MERFMTFEGRIGRQEWWIGIGILIAIGIVVGLILGLIFGDGFFGRLIQLIISVIMLALFAGLSVRRLHDREKGANPWLWIFIGFSRIEFMGESIWVPGLLASLVLWISAIVGIWAIIELGVLKGTDGPNEYGADPVA